MTKKLIFVLLIFFLSLGLMPGPCASFPGPTIADMINNAVSYDNQQVIIEAEIIGNVMKRGKITWLNVNDGSSAIGVVIASKDMPAIRYAGNYKHAGDRVRISGIFKRADEKYGGDLDIRAQQITVIEEGHKIERRVNHRKMMLVYILLPVVLFLIIIKPRL
ncbi:MAG: OB-fold nucleic acid binding domain-containing protein [Candidatus Margulisiibacteriota bacterium]|nr:OB-fold nucleic acid binding domain-containing protein [Candidatus Margulisiibacteriota bacterium]MBU1871141.1 OB-fold nucleic acid binding domain-containing protein [Patescibacteria group bacterium]